MVNIPADIVISYTYKNQHTLYVIVCINNNYLYNYCISLFFFNTNSWTTINLIDTNLLYRTQNFKISVNLRDYLNLIEVTNYNYFYRIKL